MGGLLYFQYWNFIGKQAKQSLHRKLNLCSAELVRFSVTF